MLPRSALSLVLVLPMVASCAAVYPEVRTPLRAPAAGQQLDPPPREVRFLALDGAEVPSETRDGRKWSALGDERPDPYALLVVGTRTLLRTPVARNTLSPRWADAPKGNFRVEDGERVRVELWDSNPVHDLPIGVHEVASLDVTDDANVIDVLCDSGAHILLHVEPARPKLGLGFAYELRADTAFVTRVFSESPAGRAGLKRGDELVAIGGRATKTMSTGEIQTALNAPRYDGIAIRVRHADRSIGELTLREGAVYPLFDELN